MTRPNILLITTDQQRGDALSLAGHAVLRTPHLDFIGASGTRFRRAYSEVPSCIPARHVLMSGQAPDEVGLVGFFYRNASCPWEPSATLAGELRAAGYETRMIGKLHLQPKRRRYGFDAMELADGIGGESDYVDWLRQRGVPRHLEPSALGMGSCSWLAKPHHLPEEHTNPAWVVDRAVDFLKKRDPASPFFLNLSIFSPHPPLAPSAAYFEHYDRLDLGQPAVGDWVAPFTGPAQGLDPAGGEQRVDLDPLTMHRCRAGYFGLIHELDAQIGRLLSQLGELENTLILFTSDHGEMLGDHHLFGKCEPFEGSANVPFLLRLPGARRAPGDGPEGRLCDLPVGLQDVMPTLLDAAGVDIPDSCTGRSVMPVARGESIDWRDALHGEHNGYRADEEGFHFLVNERWKYIWRSQTGKELLFDLANDPREEMDRGNEVDLDPWRRRLAHCLSTRPEGFSDGERLIAGRPHRVFVPGKGPEIEWGEVS